MDECFSFIISLTDVLCTVQSKHLLVSSMCHVCIHLAGRSGMESWCWWQVGMLDTITVTTVISVIHSSNRDKQNILVCKSFYNAQKHRNLFNEKCWILLGPPFIAGRYIVINGKHGIIYDINRCFNVNFFPVTLLTEPIVTNNVPIMHHYYFYVNVVNIL